MFKVFVSSVKRPDGKGRPHSECRAQMLALRDAAEIASQRIAAGCGVHVLVTDSDGGEVLRVDVTESEG